MTSKRFDFDSLQRMFMRTRVHATELVPDDLLATCPGRLEATLANGRMVALRQTCALLALWHRF